MKLLATAGFLLTTALVLYLGKLQQQHTLKALRGTGTALIGYLLSITFLLVGFVQFWLLTGIFPFALILALLVASLVAAAINLMIGAAVGFHPATQKKVGVLGLIWGTQNVGLGCVAMVLGAAAWLIQIGASLWIYWTHPIGDPTAVGWIAFFQFILPQFAFLPTLILLSWPTVTSPFLDDDVRNAHLAGSFTRIIYSTVALLFPVWLFEREITLVLGLKPSFWLLLSVPLLIFLVAGAFPFFVGMNRYRHQARSLLEWRLRWLRDLLSVLKLPPGPTRADSVAERQRFLEDEIRRSMAENRLLQFYLTLVAPSLQGQFVPLLPETAESPAAGEAATAGAVTDTGLRKMRLAYAKQAKQYLKGSSIAAAVRPAAVAAPAAVDPAELLREHKNDLVEWDVRFSQVYRLLDIYQNTLEAGTADINDYLDEQIKLAQAETTSLRRGRNLLAGAFASAFSTVMVWLFKTYQEPIMELIGRLFQLSQER